MKHGTPPRIRRSGGGMTPATRRTSGGSMATPPRVRDMTARQALADYPAPTKTAQGMSHGKTSLGVTGPSAKARFKL